MKPTRRGRSSAGGAWRGLACLAALAGGCDRALGGGGAPGACAQLLGVWHGHAIEVAADAGRDPDAVRILGEVLREERWRITRVTPSAYQRERVGMAGGRPVGEAMYLQPSPPGRCNVNLQTAAGVRAMTLTPRPDGTLASETAGGWFVSVYQRP